MRCFHLKMLVFVLGFIVLSGLIMLISFPFKTSVYSAQVSFNEVVSFFESAQASEEMVPFKPLQKNSVHEKTRIEKIFLININTANEEELGELPGIGPKKAAAIYEYRKMNGPFKSVDELANSKGIGEKTVENLRSLITVEND